MRITIQKKIELEIAIKEALIQFSKEMDVSYHYTEETLRYIVVTQISKLKHYGTIPNNSKTKPQLSCQFAYKKTKSKESSDWKPDIISAIWSEDRKITIPILAVELKKDHADSDFVKCMHYVNEKSGQHSFKLAIMINILSEFRFDQEFYKKQIKSRSEGKLFWCTLGKTNTGKARVVGKWF